MKFEKLTENKIRVILSTDDLDQNNVDLHSFMANSIESQDLFYTVLEKAEKEIGFATKDYKLMIEAIAVPEGNFILTLTRIKKDSLTNSKRKIQAKRTTLKFQNEKLIYEFNSFDYFCEFCNYLNLNNPSLAKKLKKAKLYTYHTKYYLCLHTSNIVIEELKYLHYTLLEFSEYIRTSILFESKLTEYGKLIAKQNAINLIIKYF